MRALKKKRSVVWIVGRTILPPLSSRGPSFIHVFFAFMLVLKTTKRASAWKPFIKKEKDATRHLALAALLTSLLPLFLPPLFFTITKYETYKEAARPQLCRGEQWGAADTELTTCCKDTILEWARASLEHHRRTQIRSNRSTSATKSKKKQQK